MFKNLLMLLVVAACSRAPAPQTVEPVELDGQTQPTEDVKQTTAQDSAPGADGVNAADAAALDIVLSAAAVGGLWVVDANGEAVGVLVQRGHADLSTAMTTDLLRDGALVYSPKAGVFFGIQMSSGKVIAPRLGVGDGTCNEVVTAGYYTDDSYVSGQSYAFVYKEQWYKVKDYQAMIFVPCGGTVTNGPDPKCSPHNGSCRGFAVKQADLPLPNLFAAPLSFAWLAPK